MNLSQLKANNLKTNYEIKLNFVKQQYAEMGKLIDSGDFDQARLRAQDLERTLKDLNQVANKLADED